MQLTVGKVVEASFHSSATATAGGQRGKLPMACREPRPARACDVRPRHLPPIPQGRRHRLGDTPTAVSHAGGMGQGP